MRSLQWLVLAAGRRDVDGDLRLAAARAVLRGLAPVEWVTDRMILEYAARGVKLHERLLPTAP